MKFQLFIIFVDYHVSKYSTLVIKSLIHTYTHTCICLYENARSYLFILWPCLTMAVVAYLKVVKIEGHFENQVLFIEATCLHQFTYIFLCSLTDMLLRRSIKRKFIIEFHHHLLEKGKKKTLFTIPYTYELIKLSNGKD